MHLLDTNALIILLFGNITLGKLSKETLNTIKTSNRIHISIVSLWEMAIKMKLGKLKITYSIAEIEEECINEGIEIIPIKAAHLDMLNEIPYLSDHKDPFDRMIMAVALSEGMTLISTDEKIRRPEYGLSVIW